MQEFINGKKLIHDLDSQDRQKSYTSLQLFSFLAVAVCAGLIVGFIFSFAKKAVTKDTKESKSTKVEKTAGIADKRIFKDKAQGVLKEGGTDGEGNFHLERPGGESQNVYLTSSTVDLSQYIGKKVRVWGETFTAEKAGWLMDVGLVEVLQ